MKPNKGKYQRTPETRARTSASMLEYWQRRRLSHPPEERAVIHVRSQDVKLLPRYATTPAGALMSLLEGAALLRWHFDPERGRWTPSLPADEALD